MMYSESKKSPPWVFWQFFLNGWEFLVQIVGPTHSLNIPIYARLQIFLSNYLQLWRSYAILSATTQFTPHFQNVHHRPRRMLLLAFSDIFPKHLGIFSPNFTRILYVHVYAGMQICINYLQLWRSYAILSATTQRAFRPMVDILSILLVVALYMA